MGSTIFVIDNSPAVQRMVEQLSAPDGHRVLAFQDGPSALEAARSQSPALIIADYHLEQMTFSGFCKEIGRQDNLAETLIVSIVDSADRLDESKLRALGVRAFLKSLSNANNSSRRFRAFSANRKDPAARNQPSLAPGLRPPRERTTMTRPRRMPLLNIRPAWRRRRSSPPCRQQHPQPDPRART